MNQKRAKLKNLRNNILSSERGSLRNYRPTTGSTSSSSFGRKESPATHRSRAQKQPLNINLPLNTRRLPILNHSQTTPPRRGPKLLTNSGARSSVKKSARLFIPSARQKACCWTASIPGGRTDISSTCYQWIHSSGTDRFIRRAIQNPLGRVCAPAGIFRKSEATEVLRCFNQLHLAVTFAMEYLYPPFQIAENKYFAVAKFCFFHRFLQGQRLV